MELGLGGLVTRSRFATRLDPEEGVVSLRLHSSTVADPVYGKVLDE